VYGFGGELEDIADRILWEHATNRVGLDLRGKSSWFARVARLSYLQVAIVMSVTQSRRRLGMKHSLYRRLWRKRVRNRRWGTCWVWNLVRCYQHSRCSLVFILSILRSRLHVERTFRPQRGRSRYLTPQSNLKHRAVQLQPAENFSVEGARKQNGTDK